ncbi:helix-turn-helix domain-containing protein [Metabacillus niabensis]|nr:helix-turn-helix domain-containing protein [Metabacillus niabensis]
MSKTTKTFRKFLLSYLVILLLPLITGIVSYQVSMDVAKKSSIESSMLILKKSKDILESRLLEVERFTKQLTLVDDFNQHLITGTEPNSINLYSLSETSRYISTYAHTNDFIEDFYIYLKNDQVILKDGYVFFRLDHFYDLYHYHDLSFDQWKKSLERNHQGEVIPVRQYTSDSKELSVVTYVQSLPLNSINEPLGTVVIIINQKKIGNLLEELSKQYGGWTFIADKEGNPLTMMGISEDSTKKVVKKLNEKSRSVNQENETILLSLHSDFNGWHYVAGIPKQALMEKAETIKQITFVVTCTTLMIGMLLCLFLAYRNSTPIHNLINVVKEQIGTDLSKHKNEYDFLHGNIATLIANNDTLKRELANQQELLKDSFVKSLLNGEFYSQKGIINKANQLNVSFRGKYGYVCVLKINGYGDLENKEIHNELSAARFIVKRKLAELETDMMMTDLGSDKIVAIFHFKKEENSRNVDEIKHILNLLIISSANLFRISISAFMGRQFHNYHEISQSYHEARLAADYNFSVSNKSKIHWYEDIIKETCVFYYPMNLELRLVNALKIGELCDVKQILNQVFQENFCERQLSPILAEQFLMEIKSTLIKTLHSTMYQNSNELRRLMNQVLQVQLKFGIQQVWKEFEFIATEYCAHVNKRKKEENHQHIKLIIEFLEANYGDPNLCLYRIAEEIGHPEKFVSQLFKEHVGEYVSDYIEKIRIHKASELLVSTEMTIEEIAMEVGYNSAHSFRRAFKRVLDMTPKGYRQAGKFNREEENNRSKNIP